MCFPSPCGCLYLYKLNWWVVYHQQILHNQSICTNIDNIEYCYCCIPEYSHDFSAQTHTHTHTSVTVTHIIDDYHCQIDIEELWWQTWTCVCVTFHAWLCMWERHSRLSFRCVLWYGNGVAAICKLRRSGSGHHWEHSGSAAAAQAVQGHHA